jgi:hypothetical protein
MFVMDPFLAQTRRERPVLRSSFAAADAHKIELPKVQQSCRAAHESVSICPNRRRPRESLVLVVILLLVIGDGALEDEEEKEDEDDLVAAPPRCAVSPICNQQAVLLQSA